MNHTTKIELQPPLTRYLKIQSSGMIVCNNRFRQHLSEIFLIENIIFKKVGPLRKYCVEGMIKLKHSIQLALKPVEILFRGKSIQFLPITEESAQFFERENQRKMYFGGVNPYTSQETLLGYFSKYGPISFFKMMDRPASNGTRFGFAIFEVRWSLDSILSSQKPIVIDGYKLFICEYSNKGQTRGKQLLSEIDSQVESGYKADQVSAYNANAHYYDCENRNLKLQQVSTHYGKSDCSAESQVLVKKEKLNHLYDRENISRRISDCPHQEFNAKPVLVNLSIHFNHCEDNIRINQAVRQQIQTNPTPSSNPISQSVNFKFQKRSNLSQIQQKEAYLDQLTH